MRGWCERKSRDSSGASATPPSPRTIYYMTISYEHERQTASARSEKFKLA